MTFTTPSNLTSIGQGAFGGVPLTSVSIPSSVTSLGIDAFGYCKSMTEINVEIGNPNYVSINGLLYDKALTTLLQYPAAKAGTTFNIPSSVTSIGAEAFAYCTSLTSVSIPSNVTSIGDAAFQSCTSLTSVSIPNGVTTIGQEMFASCTSLTSASIGRGVASIGDGAFASCTSLTSVTIPSNVTSMGSGAFQSCTTLTSVTIPNNVTSIGSYAFIFCTSLIAINVGVANPNYASADGVLYNKTITAVLQCPGAKIGTVTIPNSVTSIGDGAFEGCIFLTSLTIPNSVTTIGESAFYDCNSVTSVSIGSGVTHIGVEAFESCTSLTSLSIPNNVTSIGGYAFFQSDKLTSISFLGLVAPTNVGTGWINITANGLEGHTYAASNFPAPGGIWNGLTMGAVIPAVPDAPTGLTATPSNSQVALNWSASLNVGSVSITSFNVYRGNASGGEILLTTLGDVQTYTDPSVINGQKYYYRVSAVNSIGEGPKSNEASATPTVSVPSTPLNFHASPSISQVALNWSAPSSNGGASVSAYKVYRGNTSDGETLLITLSNVLTCTDNSLINGQKYYYRVSAVNSIGEGPKSNEVSATPTVSVPSTPLNFHASPSISQVALNWSAPSSNGSASITSFNVYRGNTSGGEILLSTLGDVLAYSDTSVINGQTYYYQVSAVNSVGEGPKSNEVSTTPATVPTAPRDS